MKGALIAPPSENRIASATLAWVGATADANYPLVNITTLEPDVVAKTTGTSATLRITFAGAGALQGIVLVNTNLRGLTLTLTNSGGMAAQPMIVPSPEDGLCVNVYWDLRAVAGASASEWNIAISGASAPIAIGTLLLIRTWTLLRVRWGWSLREKFPRIEQRTGYGKRLQYQIPVRTRTYKAEALDAAQRNLLRTIAREAHGSITPWPLIPDFHDDAALLVQFLEEEREETYRIGYDSFSAGTANGNVDIPIEVEEVNAGVAL